MSQHRRLRADRGLTLIELLIVIVILGILSAIIVFSVDGITNRGEGASCEASAQTVRIASEAFRANDPQTNHAASLDALLTSGFLAGPLPGTVSGDTISLAGGTITYDPSDGSVSDTCSSTGAPAPTGTAGGGASVLAATGPNGLVLEGGGGGGVAAGGINTTNNAPCNGGGGDCLDGTEPITVYLSGDCNQITSASVTFTGISGGPIALTGTGCTRTATLPIFYGGFGWPEDSGPVSGTITISPGTLGGPFPFTVQTG